jgi:hypothetical protein
VPPPGDGIFTGHEPKLSAVKMTANRARNLSVALLITALLNHGIFQAPGSISITE